VTDRVSLPCGIDVNTPTTARLYAMASGTGGKDNFAADRAYAEEMLAVFPEAAVFVAEARKFMRRTVRFMLSQGIRQFVDLGCGMPARGNVHQVAQQADLEARVVYVDYDPMCVTHFRVELSGLEDTTAAIHADVRQPETILKHPEVTQRIDFDRPVGLLMIDLLYMVTDTYDASRAVAAFRDAVCAGSHLALSHPTAEGLTQQRQDAIRKVALSQRESAVWRSRSEVTRLFAGFELVEPGLVLAPEWRPDRPHRLPTGLLLGGVGRVP
jgi:hypothetical protein